MSGKDFLSKRLYLGKGAHNPDDVQIPENWITPEAYEWLRSSSGNFGRAFVKYLLDEGKRPNETTPAILSDFEEALKVTRKSDKSVQVAKYAAIKLLKFVLKPEEIEKFYVSPREYKRVPFESEELKAVDPNPPMSRHLYNFFKFYEAENAKGEDIIPFSKIETIGIARYIRYLENFKLLSARMVSSYISDVRKGLKEFGKIVPPINKCEPEDITEGLTPELTEWALRPARSDVRSFLRFLKDGGKKANEATAKDVANFAKSSKAKTSARGSCIPAAKRLVKCLEAPPEQVKRFLRKFYKYEPPFSELKNTDIDPNILMRTRDFFWFMHDNNIPYAKAADTLPLYRTQLKLDMVKPKTIEATMSRIRKALRELGFDVPLLVTPKHSPNQEHAPR